MALSRKVEHVGGRQCLAKFCGPAGVIAVSPSTTCLNPRARAIFGTASSLTRFRANTKRLRCFSSERRIRPREASLRVKEVEGAQPFQRWERRQRRVRNASVADAQALQRRHRPQDAGHTGVGNRHILDYELPETGQLPQLPKGTGRKRNLRDLERTEVRKTGHLPDAPAMSVTRSRVTSTTGLLLSLCS